MTLIQNYNKFLFLEQVTGVLAQNEVQNHLLFYLARDNSKHLMVTRDNKIVLVAVFNKSYPLVAYEPDNQRDDEAEKTLVDYLTLNQLLPDSILTEQALSTRIAERFGVLYTFCENLFLYKADRVNSLAPVDGCLRRANLSDTSILLPWYIEMFQQPLSDRVKQTVEWDILSGDLFVWDKNKPVSIARITRFVRSNGYIGRVFTAKEERNKGYGCACVAGVTNHVLQQPGAQCGLFVDETNKQAQSIYKKIGYEPVVLLSKFVKQAEGI